jgi:hypothetical protein
MLFPPIKIRLVLGSTHSLTKSEQYLASFRIPPLSQCELVGNSKEQKSDSNVQESGTVEPDGTIVGWRSFGRLILFELKNKWKVSNRFCL